MKSIILVISLISFSIAGYSQSSNQISEDKEILNNKIIIFEGPNPAFVSLQNNNLSERIKFDTIDPTFIQRNTNASILAERPVFNGPEAIVINSDNNVNPQTK